MNDINIDKIYDEAIRLLKKGYSKEQILFKFAPVRNELAPLLDLSLQLLAVPKNTVPTPLMRRKYAEAKVRKWWGFAVQFSKFAVVTVIGLALIGGFAAAGFAAAQASPGQNLFALKKLEEKIQLSLAGSQQEKASLQVAIAQQRLTQAQAIFSDPSSNAAQKTAALNELAVQTSSAVAQVSSAAQTDPKAVQNPPLLSSLDSITQQQATLLTQIQPQGQTSGTAVQAAASNALAALTQTSAQLSQLKETVGIADSDQALANLASNPNAVGILGQITKLADNQATVEKTTFTLTTQTIIQNLTGTILSVHDLALGQKVNIIGLQNSGQPVAQQITIIAQPSAALAGQATSTPATSDVTSTPQTILPTASSSPASSATSTPTPTPDYDASTATQTTGSATATGSYILDGSAPQDLQ